MSDADSTANELLNIVNELAEDSINQSPEEFLQTLPDRVCKYLSVSICWLPDTFI